MVTLNNKHKFLTLVTSTSYQNGINEIVTISKTSNNIFFVTDMGILVAKGIIFGTDNNSIKTIVNNINELKFSIENNNPWTTFEEDI